MDLSEFHRPMLLETALSWLKRKCQNYSYPILSTFFFGFLAHMFIFSGKLINHDDVSALFTKGGSTIIGRWGLELADKVLPNYSMPWIYGVLSLALMAVAVCLIADLFQIRNKLLQGLLAGAIIVFPSMIGVFPYMFMSSTYTLCYLCAVFSVWLVNRHPIKGFIFAVGFLIFSLSLYQAHISVAAGLLVLVLIRQLLTGEEVPIILRRGIFFVMFLIISLGAYYGATQLILRLYGIGFGSYASNSISFSLASIPQDIVDAYRTFFQYLFQSYLGLIPTPVSKVLHITMLLMTGILLLVWCLCQKKTEPGRLALLAAMLLILPLAMNCMHLFATMDAIHTLVVFGISSIYVLAVVVCDICMPLAKGASLRRTAVNLITIALLLVILINSFLANQCYLNLHLRYENAYAFYTSLIADVKMMPEFTEGTKLAIIGSYQQPKFYHEKFSVTGNTTGITGTYGFLPDSYSADRFMEYYIGFPIAFASLQEIEAIRETQEFSQMPCYPYHGSMNYMNGIVVIKLSQ